MIRVEGLSRRYGDLKAVRDVDFAIDQGEVVGLLGHNGAGKTTIMKMLTGYLEPSAGTIRIDDLEQGPDRRAIQRRIGYLPENCPVWPEMTVIDYLDYQAALHGVPEAQRSQAVARAIRRTELAAKATAPIDELSRGFRQRVGVAQALLHEPDILILDEPTNGLDPTQILHMRDLVRELAEHATVVVSTHILQEVAAVCERVLVMRRGELVVDARLDELQEASGLLVTVDGGAPEAIREALAGVPGVRAAEPLASAAGPHRFRLAAAAETAPAVASAVTGAGFALHALEPERRDLETLFAEVNEAADAREVAHG